MSIQLSKDSIDIGIVTRNAGPMLEFYRDVVGCEFQGEMSTPTTTMQRLLCGTTVVKIVTPTNLSDIEAPPGGIGGASGIRYWTISVTNLDEMAQKCADAGRPVPVKPTEIRPGVRIAMVEDPDGNWLEFLETSG